MIPLTQAQKNNLAQQAMSVRENAYAPYSNYLVGAALLAADGTVFTGCNIENAAYSPTLCGERSAFAAAVSGGYTRFSAIAVAGWARGASEGSATPCGVCRQFMKEFFADNVPILVVRPDGSFDEYTMGELLPHGFGPDNLA